MDKVCKHCSEPWDLHHIIHDAFGSWTSLGLALMTYQPDKGIKDVDGGFWRFEFAYNVSEVPEGAFTVLLCPSCPERGK